MTPIVSKDVCRYCNNKHISINKNIQLCIEAAILDYLQYTGNFGQNKNLLL